MLEELKRQGIPVYAKLSSGYFEATEVAIMMSLLKIIDNPYQDIPLAAVLRSPIVGLTEAELAEIRINQKSGTFYEAFALFCQQKPAENQEELFEKIRPFFERLTDWRTRARQGALSQFIWQLLRETRFYEFVGGMPGGKQRQANLRALFDRARVYEATSFRGLFRFLRFIERMRDRGNDLGAAHALGEQEDVVRIMTIHSSKGLEFPVVFMAGLNRKFNMMDIRKPYMLDKEFGFAAKYVDIEKRISYPSLPQLVFKRKKKMEMLAEEMRVLYVALTRAKEKLYLLASVKDLQKSIDKWLQLKAHQDWLLPDYNRATASTFLDWVGPALIRHHDCEALTTSSDQESPPALVSSEICEHASHWKIVNIAADEVAAIEEKSNEEEQTVMDFVQKGIRTPISTDADQIVKEQLSWKYEHIEASKHLSKQSVSEIKRQQEIFNHGSGTELQHKFSKPLFKRPRFMQDKALTPAERGTAMHMVMQHVDFTKAINDFAIHALLDRMVENELLSNEQKEVIAAEHIVAFFQTELGKRLANASRIKREVPFSLSIPASRVYADWEGKDDEQVLVQGIIDCLFEDEQGVVLLDYKTDAISDRFKGGFEEAMPVLAERYRVQINLYAKAVEQILKKPVEEKFLFFFDGGHLLKLD
jgi:ATP-dependent helicase/nuclease subunit A